MVNLSFPGQGLKCDDPAKIVAALDSDVGPIFIIDDQRPLVAKRMGFLINEQH